MADRFKDWAGIVAFSLLVSLIGFKVITQMPAGLVPDDGYFYSKIAFNIGTRGFSSFDGINPTDGYHQLWEYLLAGLAWVTHFFTASKSVFLFIFVWFDLLLLTAASYFGGKTWLGRAAIFLGLSGCEFLMEGHLYAVLVAIGTWSYFTRKDRVPALALVCFALVPLARIDTLLVPLAIGAVLFLSKKRRDGTRILLACGVGALAHFGLMLTMHRHLLSVSSAIKAGGDRGFQRFLENVGQRTPTLPIPIEPQSVFAICLALVAGALVFVSQGSARGPYLKGMWLGSVLFTGAHLFLSETHPWYFAPAYIGFPLVIIWSESTPQKRILQYCTGACALLACAFLLKAFKFRNEAPSVTDFVTKLNRDLPADTRIYMVDGSGYLGYFLDCPVINGDGLVNSHEYAEELKANRLGDFLQRNHIQYLLTNKSLDPAEPLVALGGLIVNRDDAVVVATKADNGNYFFTNYLLWRVKPTSPFSRHPAQTASGTARLALSSKRKVVRF